MGDGALDLRDVQVQMLGGSTPRSGNDGLVNECADSHVFAVVVECSRDRSFSQTVRVVPLQRGIVVVRLCVLELDGTLELAPVTQHVAAHAGHVDRQRTGTRQFALIVATRVERPRSCLALRNLHVGIVGGIAVDVDGVFQCASVQHHLAGILVNSIDFSTLCGTLVDRQLTIVGLAIQDNSTLTVLGQFLP